MSAVITARWGSLDQAIRNVAALGREIGNEEVLEKALVDAGRPLRDEIARTAPRSPDAPHVADTFIVVPSKEQRAAGRAVVRVGPKAGKGVGFVAAFLEFGTIKMAARAFIRPAWDAFKGGFARSLIGPLRQHYERVVKKYVGHARAAR